VVRQSQPGIKEQVVVDKRDLSVKVKKSHLVGNEQIVMESRDWGAEVRQSRAVEKE
jgi:hypothetical protein